MISQFCLDLIAKCTSYKPSDRPSFNQIIELIRANSYRLAQNIDENIVKKRDLELDGFKKVKERTYNFVIKGKEPFEISMASNSTVKEAAEKIAKIIGTKSKDISIVLNHKKLRKRNVIGAYDIDKDAMFYVIVDIPQDFSKVIYNKNLKICGDEYEYEDGDDDDDDE